MRVVVSDVVAKQVIPLTGRRGRISAFLRFPVLPERRDPHHHGASPL
jgi:hypothetical protein